MTVSDNTIQVEGLSSFFKNLGRISAKTCKKLATKLSGKNAGRALENTSNIATAAATENPKAVSSSVPEVITFYHTGKELYLGKLVHSILHKWNKTQTDYTHQHHLKKNIDLEQRLEKKLNDVNSFINSINYIKEMITYFKDKNLKTKKKNQR